MWALDEDVPGSFPVKLTFEINFSKLVLVEVFFVVSRSVLYCFGTHTSGDTKSGS